MGVVLNTNFSTTVASGYLGKVSLQRTLDARPAASSDPSSAAAAETSGVSIQFSGAVTRAPAAAPSYNVSTGASYLQQQDRALSAAEQTLRRVNALWTLYRDTSKTAEEREAYDKEYQTLQQGLAALTEAQFFGSALFGAAGSGVMERVTVEQGAQPVVMSAKDLAAPWVGVGMVADANGAGSLDRLSAEDLAAAMGNVATMRASNASEQSSLGFTVEMLARKKANAEAVEPIEDTEVAEESTFEARSQILIKTGAAIAAQANEDGETALRLLEATLTPPVSPTPDSEPAAPPSNTLLTSAPDTADKAAAPLPLREVMRLAPRLSM